jgi:predicted O-linked N-acetylglucosamine transferase (SPINDLY family)
MGADFIDYCIADKFVIPEGTAQYFSEKIVYLPDSYQVNDTKRRISDRTLFRADCGLPAEGFVFCSFNNNYKITPPVFETWVRILKRVPKSVLWLLADNEWAAANLKREAGQRDVDPGRLIFAPRLNLADHLARHRLAGLFLDTAPVNAHTTASDALWAGLPLVTCAGKSFVARVAGSLLRAAELPELVTANLSDYEALAVKLASEPELLASLRRRLEQNRMTCPLFDIDRFRRHIETAYIRMWSTWQQGGQFEPFVVDPIGRAALDS